jgi:hypothetical protein
MAYTASVMCHSRFRRPGLIRAGRGAYCLLRPDPSYSAHKLCQRLRHIVKVDARASQFLPCFTRNAIGSDRDNEVMLASVRHIELSIEPAKLKIGILITGNCVVTNCVQPRRRPIFASGWSWLYPCIIGISTFIGKSTLLRLLAGVEYPLSGKVTRSMRPSWPIGLASCFQMQMTGADNARFIARIYQRNEKDILDYVEDFSQLGVFINQPVMNYSSGMVSRLAFGISLAITFFKTVSEANEVHQALQMRSAAPKNQLELA